MFGNSRTYESREAFLEGKFKIAEWNIVPLINSININRFKLIHEINIPYQSWSVLFLQWLSKEFTQSTGKPWGKSVFEWSQMCRTFLITDITHLV